MNNRTSIPRKTTLQERLTPPLEIGRKESMDWMIIMPIEEGHGQDAHHTNE